MLLPIPLRARRLFGALAACVALVAAGACGGRPRPAPVKRDIVLLLVDTLRADHLSIYGYPRETAPALEEFAEEAIVFEEALAPAPWTLPSVGSVLTGVYPSVHGLRAKEGGGGLTALRDAVPTLAECLRAEGYRTAAVVSNPWMRGKHHGLQRGFDDYRTIRTFEAGEVNALASRILREDDGRPLFLYLHYMGPHGPYHRHPVVPEDVLGPLPEEYDRPLTPAELATLPDYLRLEDGDSLGDYVERYDGAIHAWDREFGAWVERFERRAPEEAPIVVVVADHGEEFVEHGGWNHGETLYPEQLRVPWIMQVPGLEPQRIDDYPVSLIDVAPTLLAAVGAEVPPTMAGTDVLDGDVDPLRPLFAETDIRMGGIPDPEYVQRSVRIGEQKLIERPSGVECYDLELDPDQLDAACEDPREQRELQEELDAWEARTRRLAERLGGAEAVEVELDAEVLEELEELGYSGD